MRKATLLLLCGALALWACRKEDPVVPSRDAGLTGETLDVAGFPSSEGKVFVLNEGGMGSNNATLDFLRLSDGAYVTGAFRKMNPDAGAGLGDVGNDIAVNGDRVWIVVNNSGIVEVLSAEDETEVAAIAVPTPRRIAFDGEYAYVTSWAGAYATGGYGPDGSYSVTDYDNPKGRVFRISLRTLEVDGSVEVGYQPEGIACHDGKLYVANSGGISSQLPPDYSYDNTVSIIDTRTFRVSGTVAVQVNLKDVYSDGEGHIYVTTLGNFWDVHSGLYMLDVSHPESPRHIGDYVSVSALRGNTVYCIGTDTEFDWSAVHSYTTWSCKGGTVTPVPLSVSGTPYGLAVLDEDIFLVGDAGDYFNPGTVNCYSKGERRWSVTAGVCPGHFAVY